MLVESRRALLLLTSLWLISMCAAVRGDANFTVFADSGCTVPLGESAALPYPSSTKCQRAPDEPTVSFVLLCSSTATNASLSFSVWQTSDDCSGDATVSLKAEGAVGKCVPATLTFGGQSSAEYAHIECSSSGSGSVGRSARRWEQQPQQRQQDNASVRGALEQLIERAYATRVSRARRRRRSLLQDHRSALVAALHERR